MTTPEALKIWVPVTNYFPSLKSVSDSTELQSYYATNPAAAKLVKDLAPLVRILSPSPALTDVRGQITANVFNKVLLGRLSPEDGMLKLKAEADQTTQDALGG